MATQDYYALLEVSKDASADELKKAYRKLAMKYHPDRNPDNKQAEQKFKEINEAYETLKDPQKKAAYDRFGHEAYKSGAQGGGAGGGAGFGGFSGFRSSSGQAGGFADIFEEMFGEFMGGGAGPTGARHARAQRGADLRYDLTVSLEEAFSGLQKTISVRSSVSCSDCGGSGAKKGSGQTTCPDCHGAGMQRSQQGFFTVQQTCRKCQGTGQIIKDPCTTCHGQGRVQKSRNLKVAIPAGVEDGSRIRLAGEGEAGLHGAPAGDLYIFVSVSRHQLFVREGDNLLLSSTVPMTTASLGGEIEVPTIDGTRAKIKIPEGTQSGKRFRLRGKGMPHLRRSTLGDLLVTVDVETPVNLSERQKELLHEFNEISQKQNNSPHAARFTDKLKDFWKSFKH